MKIFDIIFGKSKNIITDKSHLINNINNQINLTNKFLNDTSTKKALLLSPKTEYDQITELWLETQKIHQELSKIKEPSEAEKSLFAAITDILAELEILKISFTDVGLQDKDFYPTTYGELPSPNKGKTNIADIKEKLLGLNLKQKYKIIETDLKNEEIAIKALKEEWVQ